ncbi:MAG TPA: radical SAM protein [Myxococcota bacterium]|nr:radical SAM protein [Myxococcota bacterium]HOA13372.1 radical SAM protein [Myxococcota bacterium]HOC99536.1 radical SAM protein [Myxococcota bacterium]HOH77053.1 radical SAM protein [Myxococcota bacterium]HPV04598.1 radical SAM protein [Myxococcota bacterium]
MSDTGRDAGPLEGAGGRGVDYGDVMVDLIMGYECNVKCDYCSVSDAMRPVNMTTAEALSELAAARAMGMHKVAFGGGEPTIRRDLLPIARWARDRGFDWIKVSSNGLMYAYQDYASRAIDAGVTDFHISVMGHEPRMYAATMGDAKWFDMVVRGVDNLVAAGHVPILDMIIKADTWRTLTETVAFWAGHGVRTFPLWLVSLTDRNADKPDSLPRVRDIFPELARVFEYSRAAGLNVYSRHIPRCMIPGYHDFVHDLRQDRVYIVTPGSRFFLWESDISANTYLPACEGCRYVRAECQGARRDYLARFGGDEIVPIKG